jgi:catalase
MSKQQMNEIEQDGNIYRYYLDDRNVKSQDTLYRTSSGVRCPLPYGVQRVGQNGPLLLQYHHHLVDLLTPFDRERIPGRVV